MCLYIMKGYSDRPIPKRVAIKNAVVSRNGKGQLRFVTPYQYSEMPFGDGYFRARNFAAGKRMSTGVVNGGYIHSYTRDAVESYLLTKLLDQTSLHNTNFHFRGHAINVYAVGDSEDQVSEIIYLPALNVRNYTEKQLQDLQKRYPGAFTKHTREILEKSGHTFQFK